MYTLKRRVPFYETDGMKVVHHANYLRWMEEARIEYLRAGRILLNDLMDNGIVFPILDLQIKYIKSAYNDDLIRIDIYLRKIDRVKMIFEYKIYNDITDELLSEARTVGANSSIETGKLIRLSEAKIQKLKEISKGDRE